MILIKKQEGIPKCVHRPEALEVIEASWERIMKLNPETYNSTLLRYISHTETEEGCEIVVAPDVSYKETVGLRYKEGFEPRDIPKEDIFQVVSAQIILRANDGTYVFIKRNRSGDWQDALDMPGGFIQDRFDVRDVLDFAKNRTASDLGIEEGFVKSARFLGLYDNKAILEMLCVCEVVVDFDIETLKQKCTGDVFAIPQNYTLEKHNELFPLRIHQPLEVIFQKFVLPLV